MKGWSSPVPGLVATEKAKVACVTHPRKPSAFTVSWLSPMANALLSNTALLSTSDIVASHKLQLPRKILTNRADPTDLSLCTLLAWFDR
jgi:hypothetical protein